MAFLGGFSIGFRIVLLRADLLVHKFFGNWLIITGLGLLMFLLLLVQQRAVMVRIYLVIMFTGHLTPVFS